jgi:ribulose 1,5-bisphosphate synthetase/thiazole synthase
MFDAAACRPRSEQCRGSVAVADGWASRIDQHMDRPLDAAVIGAGWAGLGVSYVLAKAGLSHRVLERGRIAETWLTQR